MWMRLVGMVRFCLDWPRRGSQARFDCRVVADLGSSRVEVDIRGAGLCFERKDLRGLQCCANSASVWT